MLLDLSIFAIGNSVASNDVVSSNLISIIAVCLDGQCTCLVLMSHASDTSCRPDSFEFICFPGQLSSPL